MKEIYEFLKECGTYFLATCEGEKPRVRPFGTINLFEDKLYIQTGKSKNVSKQIESNPKVEICGLLKDESKWIRVSGTLKRDDRIIAKKSMLDSYPNLRGMYDENDDNTEVLYFEKGTATISSFTEEPKTIEF